MNPPPRRDNVPCHSGESCCAADRILPLAVIGRYCRRRPVRLLFDTRLQMSFRALRYRACVALHGSSCWRLPEECGRLSAEVFYNQPRPVVYSTFPILAGDYRDKRGSGFEPPLFADLARTCTLTSAPQMRNAPHRMTGERVPVLEYGPATVLQGSGIVSAAGRRFDPSLNR